MRIPYKAVDAAMSKWLLRISTTFNRSRLSLGFDELNVIDAYSKINYLYKQLIALNEKRYEEIAKKAYDDAYDDAIAAGFTVGEKDSPSAAWVLMLLAAYDPVTKYVYNHEVERKQARLAEAVIADSERNLEREMVNDYRRAESLWRKQAMQYAIAIEDAAVIKAFKDAGVTKVKWVTADDEKVCGACDSLDGKLFEIDKVPNKPHYNCRCYITIGGVTK